MLCSYNNINGQTGQGLKKQKQTDMHLMEFKWGINNVDCFLSKWSVLWDTAFFINITHPVSSSFVAAISFPCLAKRNNAGGAWGPGSEGTDESPAKSGGKWKKSKQRLYSSPILMNALLTTAYLQLILLIFFIKPLILLRWLRFIPMSKFLQGVS